MKCEASEPEENPRSIQFIVPDESQMPLHYYTKKWAQNLIEENPIEEPFGGLHNLGNSCFLNSVLQCLAYTPGLEKFASTLPNFVYENCQEKPCFLHHFAELCKALRILKNSAPHIFFGNIKKISPEMECGIQQDAHEYLFALLNHFDDECCIKRTKATPTYDTPIHSFFGGQYKETRSCSKCLSSASTSTKFLDITLPLDADTIEGCFESFMQERNVGSNYICDTCKETGNCYSKTIFEEMPNILVITMMRFSALGFKVEKQVEFGPTLDLSPFTEEGVNAFYELFAIINHSGHVINRGHFTCAVKVSNGFWYSCDDSKINRESSQNVLDSRPYVLFYRRRFDELATPINVTFGYAKPEKKKRTVIPKTRSKERLDDKPPKQEEIEDVKLPEDPMEGFVSEVSDIEDPEISDGRVHVDKTFVANNGRLISVSFVCTARKK